MIRLQTWLILEDILGWLHEHGLNNAYEKLNAFKNWFQTIGVKK